MICPECQTSNPEGSQFCQNCGATLVNKVVGKQTRKMDTSDLANACPECQQENPAEAQFCQNCGASLNVVAAVPVKSAGKQTQKIDGVEPGEICPKCHNENPPGAQFCETCGMNLIAAAPPIPAKGKQTQKIDMSEDLAPSAAPAFAPAPLIGAYTPPAAAVPTPAPYTPPGASPPAYAAPAVPPAPAYKPAAYTPPNATPNTMPCPHCGETNPATALYCQRCLADLKEKPKQRSFDGFGPQGQAQYEGVAAAGYKSSGTPTGGYGATRIIGQFSMLLAWGAVGIGGLIVLGGLLTLFRDGGFLIGLGIMIMGVFWGGVFHLIFRLIAESISIILDIATNTNRTADLLEQLVKQNASGEK